jgi:hypothetical protein
MRKGIFQIDKQSLKSILGLPDEAEILDMIVENQMDFHLNDGRDAVLKVKVKWDRLPLEVRDGEVIPPYDLFASADKKNCGHTEIEACLAFDNDTKSDCWRMK